MEAAAWWVARVRGGDLERERVGLLFLTEGGALSVQ